MDPLRAEHQELLPEIERLKSVADMVGEAPLRVLRGELSLAYEFLAHHLLVHAQAEDRALYPAVADAMGSPRATATMQRDHLAVEAMVNELGGLIDGLPGDEPTADQAKALRRVLYGLYALVRVHFDKEEEIYLPLLDSHLSPQAAAALFQAMGAAAAEARSALSP
jgi:iron-sulfur cluster repair protein YtfE (RIC family)